MPPPPRAARRLLAAALAATLAATLALAAPAAGQGLVRDATGEHALRQIAGPILAAAGLSSGRVRVLMIGDNSMNAFVGDARTILVHTGLILRLKSADELQAVLAHEAAHIANGHLARRIANAHGAAQGAFAGLLLGLAAGAAGAGGKAAAGIAAGTAGSAQRIFLAHTRAEEAAADQSGIRFMAAAGADPAAALDVLDLFRGQELLAPERQDPYAQTHPLSRDRLRALRGYVAAQGAPPAPSAASDRAEYWFARVQATVAGFMQNPATTLRRYPASDTSDAALIARAAAFHRRADAPRALAEIDALIARRPDDAFAHDLRGQILLESRRFEAAVAAYRRAAALAPSEPLILAGLGRALTALDTPAANREALSVLERAQGRDGADPRMLRDLAVAYARAGQAGMASVVTAERYALVGQLDTAAVHARRAAGALPRGSPGWLRAQDVLGAAEAAANRR